MKCSQNELASLFKKAAMGKGYPEGLAKEIASAALALPSENAEAALSCLTAKGSWSVAKNGPALFDQALMALSANDVTEFNQILIEVDCPEMLEGMALAAARQYGLVTEILEQKQETHISIRLGDPIPAPKITGAIDVALEIYQALNSFAQKTYVPATDASRLRGAGAGLTDND